MGRIEWDVKDCMHPRQDYIIVVKEKRRDTSRKKNSPGDAETHGVHGVAWRGGLSWQHVGNAHRLEEFQGRSFWFGGMAGGAVTVTAKQLVCTTHAEACCPLLIYASCSSCICFDFEWKSQYNNRGFTIAAPLMCVSL